MLLRASHEVKIFDVGPDTGGDEDRMISIVRDADALISLLDNPVTRRVLSSCPDLKIVAQCAVGYDNIDLEAAEERRIVVTHTPGVLTDATADFTLALLLAVARHVCEADTYVRDGHFRRWETLLLHGMELRGKVLGIVGFGRIGQAVARRALGFGMKIVYHSRQRANPTTERMMSANHVSMDELLTASDVVSIHCPLNEASRHLIGASAFSRMKSTALLINTGRGPIVDEAALAKAIQLGELAGAGIDVYENEPIVHPGLLEHPRVILTPHLASATVEARTAMAAMCSEAILATLGGNTEIPYRLV